LAKHYQPVLHKQFCSGFGPTEYQKSKINSLICRQVFSIVDIVFSWSNASMLTSGDPGFEIDDMATAFRNSFKGKRGYTVSLIQLEETADSIFDAFFTVTLRGDGWWTRLDILSAVELIQKYDEEGERLRSDDLKEVTIYSSMDAEDEAGFAKMMRWWTTVDPLKAEG